MKLGLKGSRSAYMNTIKACVGSLASGRPKVCVLIGKYSVHHSLICRFTQCPLAIRVYHRPASSYEESRQKSATGNPVGSPVSASIRRESS